MPKIENISLANAVKDRNFPFTVRIRDFCQLKKKVVLKRGQYVTVLDQKPIWIIQGKDDDGQTFTINDESVTVDIIEEHLPAYEKDIVMLLNHKKIDSIVFKKKYELYDFSFDKGDRVIMGNPELMGDIWVPLTHPKYSDPLKLPTYSLSQLYEEGIFSFIRATHHRNIPLSDCIGKKVIVQDRLSDCSLPVGIVNLKLMYQINVLTTVTIPATSKYLTFEMYVPDKRIMVDIMDGKLPKWVKQLGLKDTQTYKENVEDIQSCLYIDDCYSVWYYGHFVVDNLYWREDKKLGMTECPDQVGGKKTKNQIEHRGFNPFRKKKITEPAVIVNMEESESTGLEEHIDINMNRALPSLPFNPQDFSKKDIKTLPENTNLEDEYPYENYDYAYTDEIEFTKFPSLHDITMHQIHNDNIFENDYESMNYNPGYDYPIEDFSSNDEYLKEKEERDELHKSFYKMTIDDTFNSIDLSIPYESDCSNNDDHTSKFSLERSEEIYVGEGLIGKKPIPAPRPRPRPRPRPNEIGDNLTTLKENVQFQPKEEHHQIPKPRPRRSTYDSQSSQSSSKTEYQLATEELQFQPSTIESNHKISKPRPRRSTVDSESPPSSNKTDYRLATEELQFQPSTTEPRYQIPKPRPPRSTVDSETPPPSSKMDYQLATKELQFQPSTTESHYPVPRPRDRSETADSASRSSHLSSSNTDYQLETEELQIQPSTTESHYQIPRPRDRSETADSASQSSRVSSSNTDYQLATKELQFQPSTTESHYQIPRPRDRSETADPASRSSPLSSSNTDYQLATEELQIQPSTRDSHYQIPRPETAYLPKLYQN